MRPILPVVLSLAPLLPAQSPESEQLDLRVLYAGVPDAPRAAAWRTFLEPRTTGFEAIAAGELSVAASEDFDVVVLDCPDPIMRDENGRPTRIKVPETPGLTATFGRPVIVVGGMALRTDRLDLKSNWL